MHPADGTRVAETIARISAMAVRECTRFRRRALLDGPSSTAGPRSEMPREPDGCSRVRAVLPHARMTASVSQRQTVSPAIFLDRDGVLNENWSDYVKSWAEFRWIPGVLDALAALSRL